ncbi:hypothetical protein Q5P01_011088 [Channa striata]|uniref:Uncharacterized protein n=1 Tax=Channa striata TaxID=64152 RepID=A0AA88MTK9_CHASR|nr:hypothetical protein Q5P01_011088 [Channa striata]
MKHLMCCFLILPFATVGMTGPVRVQREDVLSFITDAVEKTSTNEKAVPANFTGHRNPPSKSVTKDSEDTSEEWSAESFATNGHTDAAKDLDSDETMIPLVLEKDKAPLRMKTEADMKSVGLMDASRRLVQDHGSREQRWPKGPHQASRELTGFHSEEEITQLPGKQVIYRHGATVTGSTGQKKAGRVDALNGMLAHDESRELDRDSLEDVDGRPFPVRHSRDRDYDETREYSSSETYPQVPPRTKAL